MQKPMAMLQEIVRELARKGTLPKELATLELTPDLVLDEMGIDSLGMASMLTELEDRVGEGLPDDALERFRTVGDIVAYLEAGR